MSTAPPNSSLKQFLGATRFKPGQLVDRRDRRHAGKPLQNAILEVKVNQAAELISKEEAVI